MCVCVCVCVVLPRSGGWGRGWINSVTAHSLSSHRLASLYNGTLGVRKHKTLLPPLPSPPPLPPPPLTSPPLPPLPSPPSPPPPPPHLRSSCWLITSCPRRYTCGTNCSSTVSLSSYGVLTVQVGHWILHVFLWHLPIVRRHSAQWAWPHRRVNGCRLPAATHTHREREDSMLT